MGMKSVKALSNGYVFSIVSLCLCKVAFESIYYAGAVAISKQTSLASKMVATPIVSAFLLPDDAFITRVREVNDEPGSL